MEGFGGQGCNLRVWGVRLRRPWNSIFSTKMMFQGIFLFEFDKINQHPRTFSRKLIFIVKPVTRLLNSIAAQAPRSTSTGSARKPRTKGTSPKPSPDQASSRTNSSTLLQRFGETPQLHKPAVEARKLQHHYPHALKIKYSTNHP